MVQNLKKDALFDTLFQFDIFTRNMDMAIVVILAFLIRLAV